MKTIASLLIIALLLGCAARFARVEMQKSKAIYQQCLEQNPRDHEKCETLRKIYESDLNAYRAIQEGKAETVIFSH